MKQDKKGELKDIQLRINKEVPAPGHLLANDRWKKFEEFPISQRTKDGLKKVQFDVPTAIQRSAIPHALVGRDVLGAAKTGSGKTLAFLIPVLERLYRLNWGPIDGLGALIIAPTRELAVQIFEVLRNIGSCHDLSAGLLIGGKSFEQEANVLPQMNIVIGTPGRILHHLDHTPMFSCDNIQILVIDEADRCLDLGFKNTLDSIVQSLPKNEQRQTLLFSATQTKSTSDLARLSLKKPEYISSYAQSSTVTPSRLVQTYIVCEPHEKINSLFSFLKTHPKMKGIVFVNTCKEVRYYYEIFKRLRIGNFVEQLHGRMQQHRRTSVYYDYIGKESAVLFATDIAARGLDFPDIDWVIQLNCPDDVDTYIHRVGRTARYKNNGRALLMIGNSEIKFIEKLQERKIEVKKVSINPAKIVSVTPKVESFLAEDPDLKYLGQKAFITYMRSVFLQKDKEVFQVDKIDAVKLSQSMGLPGAPKIKMIHDANVKKLKNMNHEMKKLLNLESSNNNDNQPRDKVTKLLNRKNRNLYDESREKLRGEDAETSDDEEFLRPSSRVDRDIESDIESEQSYDEAIASEDDSESENSESGEEEETQKSNLKRKWSQYLISEKDAGSASSDLLAKYSASLKAKVEQADPEDRERERERVRTLHKLQKEIARSEANQHLQQYAEEESEGEIIEGSSDEESQDQEDSDDDESSDE